MVAAIAGIMLILRYSKEGVRARNGSMPSAMAILPNGLEENRRPREAEQVRRIARWAM
jgi:hypothetical protein